jgi:putative ABC transport system ATP-binding protein
MSGNVIFMKDIVKKFFIGTPNELQVLNNVSITVREGEFISIIGASGSGKSTLMNILGALDRPTSGEYILDGSNTNELNDNKLSDIRNRKIGFVFQTFNLIPRSTALKNIELPLLYKGESKSKRIARAKELLELVEMSDRSSHLPNELSGGQKQRVAIARAMANDPAILLADEPTGALDSKTGRLVMDIFHKLHEQEGKTVILITHNPTLAGETERILTIEDGRIVDEKVNENYAYRADIRSAAVSVTEDESTINADNGSVLPVQ